MERHRRALVRVYGGQEIMGKRSSFERKKLDFYPTPFEAVVPLFPHLVENYNFIEPCAGDGRLIRHLESQGHKCVYACDIEPRAAGIERRDILMFDESLPSCRAIITNPPWERDPLHRMIEKFRHHAPTWLLFDSDWLFTIQAKPHLPFCHSVVAIGRVSWEGNGVSGMDNCCWYGFGEYPVETIFYGR